MSANDQGNDARLSEQEIEHLLASPAHDSLGRLLGALRSRMRARFQRHVPTGTLLHDRWQLAQRLGFGERSSVYDECLVLGDVRVGSDCWIGPYTILDGAHASLRIGDHTSVAAGCQLYTHDTIERALCGSRGPIVGRPTTIGRCCFLGPLVVIGPGTTLGDHCFVAAGSYLSGAFASHSFIAGNPARRQGRVEIEGDRARLIREWPRPAQGAGE
jgi:acetyltransferase-like isoleucine patch superfamily enzyme